MKKYPEYKDSGIEWITEIPSHWKVTKIKGLPNDDINSFIDGDWIESPYITDSGIRYITTGNIGEGKYKEQGNSYISDETFEELNCTEVYAGDLLISRLSLPIGRCCIIPDLGHRIVTSVDNVILRPKEGILKKFIMYLMNTVRYFEYTSQLARGTTLLRISRSMLGNIKIILPPVEEQTAIASFLDHKTRQIDDLIAKKERLIELLKEERTAVINQAVTKGLDPNVPMKDSGIEWLGEIPEHWTVKRLKYSVEINKNKLSEDTDQEYEFKYVDIGNVSFGKLENDPPSMTFKDAPSRARRVIHKGDTIVSTVRTYLKAITYIDESLDSQIASTGFAVLTPLGTILEKYLFYLSTSDVFVEKVCSISVGVSYPATNAGDIGNIKVWLPTMQEQIEIVEYISYENDKIDNLIKIHNTQIDLLKEYKTSLINEVVTGKIMVTDGT